MSPDEQVGPYRLVRPLGEGGMGQVFEATREDLGAVALKVLVTTERPEAVGGARLLDEARLAQWVAHPNVVRVLDFGVAGQRPFLAMELLRGRTLSRLGLEPGRGLPPAAVVGIGIQALAGLAAAHGAKDPEGTALGIVHRDIKPSNLFLGEDGVVKVIDFGIARAKALDQTESRTGVVRGSVAYCSPEQVRAEPLDARTDLYSLGLVLHELLTGQRVHRFDTDAAVITSILFSPIPPVRGTAPKTPAKLDEALARALDKDRSQRFESAEAFSRALVASLGETPPWTVQRLGELVRGLPAESAVAPSGTATWARPHVSAPVVVVSGPVPVRPRRRFGGVLALTTALAALGVGAYAWTQSQKPVPVAIVAAVPAAIQPPAEHVIEKAPEREPAPEPAPQPVAPVAATHPVHLPSPKPTRRRHIVHAPVVPRPAPSSDPAFLTINAEPTYGRVFVDGVSVGLTPAFRVPTTAGKHVIDVTREDGRRQRQIVTLKAQELRKLVFQW